MRTNDTSAFDEAAEFVLSRTVHRPTIALILGSGLGAVARDVQFSSATPYEDIPRFPLSTAPEHAGKFIVGRMAGQAVAILQGRAHFYEGYSMDQVVFPIRVLQRMGVTSLIVTNAAGGLNPEFRAGDIMLIRDHLNIPAMAGHHPLRGPNNSALGQRFPSMSQAYDSELQTAAWAVADRESVKMVEGIYACVAGPSFETPAEVRMLRALGADAVGMSTAPEVIVARHAGMRVLGFSAITNIAIAETETGRDTTAEEVLEAGPAIAARLKQLVAGVMADQPDLGKRNRGGSAEWSRG